MSGVFGRAAEALGAAVNECACMVYDYGEVVTHCVGVDLAVLGGRPGLPFCEECAALGAEHYVPPSDDLRSLPGAKRVVDDRVARSPVAEIRGKGRDKETEPSVSSVPVVPEPEPPRRIRITLDDDESVWGRGWSDPVPVPRRR